MSESVGESTSETKVVAESSWMVPGTSSTGLMRHLMSAGMNLEGGEGGEGGQRL
jgi:hypothetical protein